MRALAALVLALVAYTPATAAWREARSQHFIVYSEDKPEALRQFATDLEKFDAAMRMLRSIDPSEDSPHNRVTVFVVSSISQVRDVLGDKKNSQVAGFYRGIAGRSVAVVPRDTGDEFFSSRLVLLHEYSHHFMFRNFPLAFPAWFREGFAEFSAAAAFNKDGSVDLGRPASHRAYELLEMVPTPARAIFENKIKGGQSAQTAAIYARGWLLTHYLTFSKERKGQLGSYLRELNNGKSSIAAAEAAFGDLRQLDIELNRYVRSRMTYLKLGSDKLKIGPVEVRDLSAGASAIMPYYLRVRAGIETKGAAALVAPARQAAAPHAADAFAQLALAEIELAAENHAEADAAAERALAADPASIPAMLIRGQVGLIRARASKPGDDAAWKAARRWFVRANRSEPAAPEPLVWYYRSFLEEGVAPPANALQGLKSATILAPEDTDLRMRVALQLLRTGGKEEARTLLAPVAFDPHGGKRAEAAAAIVAAIDRGESPTQAAADTAESAASD
jgi:tetratricopeptide (TPR) repeat protein